LIAAARAALVPEYQSDQEAGFRSTVGSFWWVLLSRTAAAQRSPVPMCRARSAMVQPGQFRTAAAGSAAAKAAASSAAVRTYSARWSITTG
jgi:hypothetical protein